jgi:hypothetical protein
VKRIDYSKFGEGKAPSESFDQGVGHKWWRFEGDEAVGSVTSTLAHLQDRQKARITQHVIGARLYGNLSMLGFGGLGMSRLMGSGPSRERISYNVGQSALDTVVSKIGKNKPRPLFLPSGGDYRIQRKAKGLNRFVDGVFYENGAYDLGPVIFKDAGCFGDGMVKVFAHNGRVKFERRLSSELWIDELEAFYGSPRSTHETKNVDRDVLLETFPDDKDYPQRQADIIEASQAHMDESGGYQTLADAVNVRESWHLPSGPDATDGVHMISTRNAVLFREEWKHDFFPFAKFTWNTRLWGYWGQSLMEQIQSIQFEINKLMQLIQRSFHLGGSYKILMENGSKVVSQHFNNEVGLIIKYTGTKPEYVVPQLVPPEIFQHLLTLKAAAFELAGISQLSATAQKPAGLNSGKALREYNDIESDRFQTIGHAYETFFLDLGRISIAIAKDIGKSYKVRAAGRRSAQVIDWKDVNLAEEDYILQCYPVSSLPREPAGRLQTVQEYMQAGLLSPRQGKRLLDFPDLEQIETLGNASEEYLEMILEKIVDEGVMVAPEPYDDLKLAREMALEHYAWGKSQGLEEERLELLRRFLGEIDRLEAPPPVPEQITAPPAGPGGGPGVPQANPQPPPRSEMIANVPGITAAA